MTVELDQVVDAVRALLMDEPEERWSDEQLEAHIVIALGELSAAWPLEARQELTADGSRFLDVSALVGVLRIDAVEWPLDEFPASFVAFSHYGELVSVQERAYPASGEQVRVYYAARRTLGDGDQIPSTVEESQLELLALGAAAKAAIAWASLATNRANVAGPRVAERYLEWGQRAEQQFHGRLAETADRRRVRAGQLYVPHGQLGGRDIVQPPPGGA